MQMPRKTPAQQSGVQEAAPWPQEDSQGERQGGTWPLTGHVVRGSRVPQLQKALHTERGLVCGHDGDVHVHGALALQVSDL